VPLFGFEQVLFLVEALPAVLFGVIVAFWMADWPRDPGWLTEPERELLTRQYEREVAAKTAVRRFTGSRRSRTARC